MIHEDFYTFKSLENWSELHKSTFEVLSPHISEGRIYRNVSEFLFGYAEMLDRYMEEIQAPKVATILRELEVLSAAMAPNGRFRNTSLSYTTLAVIAGEFPNSGIHIGDSFGFSFANDTTSTTILMKHHYAIKRLHGEADVSHIKFYYPNISENILNKFMNVLIDILESSKALKEIKTQLDAQEISEIRDHLDMVRQRIMEAFSIQSTAGKLNTFSFCNAPFIWHIHVEFQHFLQSRLDNPDNSNLKSILKSLVDCALVYLSKLEPRNPAFKSFDYDAAIDFIVDNRIAEQILILHHQIDAINTTISSIEERLSCCEKNTKGSKIVAARYLVLVLNLRDWRRELERRLHFGDYRTRDNTMKRPVGHAMPVPDFPKLSTQWTLVRKIGVFRRVVIHHEKNLDNLYPERLKHS